MTEYRKLIRLDDPLWEKLPKDIKGLPVYFRKTATGVEMWPMWEDGIILPDIGVRP